MRTDTLRRTAQAMLAAIAVLAAAAAGFRYFSQGGEVFGERVIANPSSGPVGIQPTLQIRGYDGGKSITVYLCVGATSEIGDCALLGKGTTPTDIRSKPIPQLLPDSSDVVPGTYVLRAGPDAQGAYPVRGSLRIVRFRVGKVTATRSFAGVDPANLEIGSEREIARGAACRPPTWLGDGRLAVGSTIVDPATGVQIALPFQASEAVWSPDGRKLAYITPDTKEIRIADPDGKNAIAKEREARGLLNSLSWSGDSTRLALVSRDDPNVAPVVGGGTGGPGPPTVRILNTKTGQITPAGPGLAVAWSPRADLLAVQRIGDQIEFSTLSGVRRGFGPGKRAIFTPDGAMLAYVHPGENGSDQGWLAQLQGTKRSAVVSGGVCGFSVSPTGRQVAVVKETPNGTRLVLRAINGVR